MSHVAFCFNSLSSLLPHRTSSDRFSLRTMTGTGPKETFAIRDSGHSIDLDPTRLHRSASVANANRSRLEYQEGQGTRIAHP